jgi:hypothetical protein
MIRYTSIEQQALDIFWEFSPRFGMRLRRIYATKRWINLTSRWANFTDCGGFEAGSILFVNWQMIAKSADQGLAEPLMGWLTKALYSECKTLLSNEMWNYL